MLSKFSLKDRHSELRLPLPAQGLTKQLHLEVTFSNLFHVTESSEQSDFPAEFSCLHLLLPPLQVTKMIHGLSAVTYQVQ